MNLSKNSNKSYVLFLAITLVMLIMFVIFSVVFKSELKNKSLNYDKVLTLNSYSVKVSDAFYNTKTKELSFVLRVKTNFSSASLPTLTEVFIENRLDYSWSSKTVDEHTQLVTIAGVPSDFYFARLKIVSKKPDIQPEPTVDEFGDVVTHPVIEGEENSVYVYIDARDATFGGTPETFTGSSFVDETVVTTLTPTETTSQSVKTTIPKVTTATKKTSQSATQSVVTTTKKKVTTTTTTTKKTTVTATTPEQTTTKKPASVVTTTPKVTTTVKPTTTVKKTTTTPKLTTTTKKATTTTKKPVVTTTTTKKKVTTTTTTTKATTTTTTVYIRLTGLALAEKGSEELLLGESVTLTPVYTPSKATNKKVYWSSNRPDRVIVDSNGKCTAVGVGSAIIICTSDDGGLTAAYMITGVDG